MPPIAVTEKQGCGFAALSSVALYHGIDAAALQSASIKERFTGRALSARDLVAMAEAVGLAAYGYEGKMEDLVSNVGKGRPMIVMLSSAPGIGHSPLFDWAFETAKAVIGKAHWVVVVGLEAEDRAIVYDPPSGYIVMSRDVLDKAWAKQSRVCVLATTSGKKAVAGTPTGPK